MFWLKVKRSLCSTFFWTSKTITSAASSEAVQAFTCLQTTSMQQAPFIDLGSSQGTNLCPSATRNQNPSFLWGASGSKGSCGHSVCFTVCFVWATCFLWRSCPPMALPKLAKKQQNRNNNPLHWMFVGKELYNTSNLQPQSWNMTSTSHPCPVWQHYTQQDTKYETHILEQSSTDKFAKESFQEFAKRNCPGLSNYRGQVTKVLTGANLCRDGPVPLWVSCLMAPYRLRELYMPISRIGEKHIEHIELGPSLSGW